jgi:hypothetical protein
MSKFVQAFLSGIFFTFILDFFLFLGIKKNYTDFYEVGVYYNVLFADNQNALVFFLLAFFTGIFIIYVNNKITVLVLGVMFLLSASTLIPKVGYKAGEFILMQKNMAYRDAKHIYLGDAYFVGRETILFYDNELKKIILLDKKELKQ